MLYMYVIYLYDVVLSRSIICISCCYSCKAIAAECCSRSFILIHLISSTIRFIYIFMTKCLCLQDHDIHLIDKERKLNHNFEFVVHIYYRFSICLVSYSPLYYKYVWLLEQHQQSECRNVDRQHQHHHYQKQWKNKRKALLN